jgi:hypothetical protein
VDNIRHGSPPQIAGLHAFGLQVLDFLSRLLRLTVEASPVAGASALGAWLGHTHYSIGDAVCLLLIFVFWFVDREFCLYAVG